MTAWWLLGLAIVGLAVSLYFALAYYGLVELRAVPAALCRREERTCMTILATPYARLFGVPNALLGLGFYLLTGIVAGLALLGRLPAWLWRVEVGFAVLAVVLAPYLVWALLARLKTACPL